MAVKASHEVTIVDETDASAVVEWYAETTGSVAPSAPQTSKASAVPTGWSKAEPTVSSAADLSKCAWRCLQLVWGDGSCSWGEVTLSASFEAAKVAYNEAQAAKRVATSYISDVTDGIFVHPENYDEADVSTHNGWRIRDVLEMIIKGVSRFWIGIKTGDTTPTVRIGKEYVQGATDNESRMELDYHSMQLFDADGVRYFHVSDLRDRDGFIVETFTAPGGTNVFSLMALPSTNPQGWATIDGEPATVYNLETSSQRCSVSPTPEEGSIVVIGYKPRYYGFAKAFTFGYRKADEQVGAMSFCEGIGNAARGEASHAEGEHNVANEYGAHAEGARCTALGSMAHAEGSGTLAGYAAHAEGEDTTASQIGSHSQNVGTKAAKMAQTALGSYNVEDSASTTTHPSGTNNYGQYAVIIGNGTSDDDRSNALAVDWNGNALIAGEVQDMSGNAKYTKTRVKGNAETSYRTGDVNLTPADIGAAAASHGNHVPAVQTANNAVYLRNDNTWHTITPANIGAAAASHGNHVPTTQTANNATFLRNDNTWHKVTPSDIGAAASSHTHASLVKVVSASSTVDISANSNHTFAPELTIPSGYTLVAAVGVKYTANNANLSTGSLYKYSATKIAANVVNHSSSKRSVTVTTYGLCVLSGFVG